MKNKKPSGYLLHETATHLVIATMESDNPKTGNMVQLWILPREVNPVQALKDGTDDIVCFDCKHRGANGKGRTCYVLVHNAPNGVWKAYQRGRYPKLAIEDYKYTFRGRKIRFGAYGDPVLIPMNLVAELARVSDGWTGYTHQWRHEVYAPYKAYIMASCDTPAEYDAAKLAGWRTFRVRTAEQPLLPREITCPASDEAGYDGKTLRVPTAGCALAMR